MICSLQIHDHWCHKTGLTTRTHGRQETRRCIRPPSDIAPPKRSGKGAITRWVPASPPSGVNFALYSKHATEVFLLLFEPAEGEPTDIMQLQHRTKFIWHCFVPGFRAGQLYGYKVRGEYRPEWGCALMRQSSSLIRTPRLLPGSFA